MEESLKGCCRLGRAIVAATSGINPSLTDVEATAAFAVKDC
jgi:hypothetical protein